MLKMKFNLLLQLLKVFIIKKILFMRLFYFISQIHSYHTILHYHTILPLVSVSIVDVNIDFIVNFDVNYHLLKLSPPIHKLQ